MSTSAKALADRAASAYTLTALNPKEPRGYMCFRTLTDMGPGLTCQKLLEHAHGKQTRLSCTAFRRFTSSLLAALAVFLSALLALSFGLVYASGSISRINSLTRPTPRALSPISNTNRVQTAHDVAEYWPRHN